MVRHKNRYLVIELNPVESNPSAPFLIRTQSVFRALTSTIEKVHGDFGVAATTQGFMAKYCNENTRIALIKARHGPHRLVASSIPFITRIESHQFLMGYQKRKFEEFCVGLKTDEERAEMKKKLLNLDSVMGI